VFFQICILDGSAAVPREAIGNSKHDVSALLRGVEDAAAIGKTAIVIAQFKDLSSLDFQDAHAGDGFRYLLPVSADILDRSAAYCAGDAAEAFNPCVAFSHSVIYERIPIVAGAHMKDIVSGFCLLRNSANRDLQNQSWPALVGDDEIAASTQDEERALPFSSVGQGCSDFIVSCGLDKIAGRASYLKGGQRSQRNVFLDQQCFASDYSIGLVLGMLIYPDRIPL